MNTRQLVCRVLKIVTLAGTTVLFPSLPLLAQPSPLATATQGLLGNLSTTAQSLGETADLLGQSVSPRGNRRATNLALYRLTRYSTVDKRSLPEQQIDISLPLDVAIDSKGTPWVTGEFQRTIKKLRQDGGGIQQLEIPSDGNIFAWGESSNTEVNSWAEDITFDGHDKIWITQGGGGLGSLSNRVNHSRIISFDINDFSREVYRIPGNQNTVTSIAWDDKKQTMWFIESGIARDNPKLVSFTPGSIDLSRGFDTPHYLNYLICQFEDSSNCYRVYDIPYRFPARMIVGARGNIWFVGYFSNYLARFNPETGTFLKIQLPQQRNNFHPDIESSFPWDIALDPTTGDIIVTESFDRQILRFKIAEFRRHRCHGETLHECFQEYDARPPASEHDVGGVDMTHSLDVDQNGNIWFTSDNCIGLILAGSKTARFRRIPGQSGSTARLEKDHMTGIKVDDNTGVVWVNSYMSRELYKLTPPGHLAGLP